MLTPSTASIRQRRCSRLALKVVLPSLMLLFVAGCPPLEPSLFAELAEASAALRSDSDTALQEIEKLAEQGFRTPSALDGDIRLGEVVLTWSDAVDADPTQPTQEAQPLHTLVRDLRRGTYSPNTAFVDYSLLLAKLAGAETAHEERLSQLAKDANTNLRTANDALKLELNNEEVGFISAGGIEILRQSIRSDQRRLLQKLIPEAQPAVDEFSEHMVTTMNLLAGDINSSAQRGAHRRLREGERTKC